MPEKKQKRRVTSKKGHRQLDTEKLAAKLTEYQGEMSDDELADKLDVSKNTIIRWRSSDESPAVGVKKKKAKNLANNLGISIEELLYINKMPIEPEFYEAISYGWFIDTIQSDGRGDSKKPRWFSELIKLKLDPVDTERNGRPSFRGTIENCRGNTFSIRAELMSDYIFCILSDNKNAKMSFVGVASRYIAEDGNLKMLIGTWSGTDHVGYTAVFRWILTNREISEKEIIEISKDYHIETYFKADKPGDNFYFFQEKNLSGEF